MRLALALIAMGLALLIASCATSTLQGVADRQAEYCATADPVRRAVLLSIIRSQVPEYPERGLCTDSGRVLAEAMDRSLEGREIDVKAAREDQRRFSVQSAQEPPVARSSSDAHQNGASADSRE